MTLLAIGVDGGKEKVDQTLGLLRAVAKSARSVVMEAVVIIRPCFEVIDTAR